MTNTETVKKIEEMGYRVLAQTRHPGALVSYDATKGHGKWPHSRKLAKGEARKTPYQAMRALHRACIERDLPRFKRTVTA